MKVTATDARRDFALLLEKVIAGEEVVIERHGRPVAKLVSASHAPSRAAVQARLSDVRGIDSNAPLARILRGRAAERFQIAHSRAAGALSALASHGVKARLIGSLARGEFRATSDVDILVEDRVRLSELGIEDLVRAAMGDFPFDIVHADELPPALGPHFR